MYPNINKSIESENQLWQTCANAFIFIVTIFGRNYPIRFLIGGLILDLYEVKFYFLENSKKNGQVTKAEIFFQDIC